MNSLLERINRLRILISLVINPAETVMSFGHLRFETHGLLVSIDRFRVLAGIQEGVALIVVIICVQRRACGGRTLCLACGGSGNRATCDGAFGGRLRGCASHVLGDAAGTALAGQAA